VGIDRAVAAGARLRLGTAASALITQPA